MYKHSKKVLSDSSAASSPLKYCNKIQSLSKNVEWQDLYSMNEAKVIANSVIVRR